MVATIRAASLRGFQGLVRRLGGEPEVFLSRYRISADVLDSDDGLVPITEHDLMLDAAAAELGCPDLGLQLAESQDLSILGPLALAIAASPTVTEALQCVSRFMFVHSPALHIGVTPDPRGRRGVVALTYRKDLSESSYSPQAMELGVGLFYRVAISLLHLEGPFTGLHSVELPHQPLSPVRRYTEFFGVDAVRFGASLAALRVDQRMLDESFTTADETIRRLALDHLTRHYQEPATTVSVAVRRAVAQRLGISGLSLTQTAHLMGMHPRTLQRRLAAEGTGFEKIVDDVRREASWHYVTSTAVPFSQVAERVGFSEQAALTHAVRRWFDASPRALRVREGADGR
ncbi:AraC family transcriptional regulator [Luteipulveratus sp. YIM 133132]|uniref:AraC family transcriptional regulator n=1 Tax=Luteipulveratus flavus TaxID=3031728 RepID=UPI0023B18B07|nr:AraC family transcriptional regulator [Luteipulveratus sp. YIM 133132]MDE9366901.1 AraC family transcriptional regulator [Luteipulveratus sp. YIM 133132]